MIETRIILAAVWIVIALLYLEGDVFRIFSGDAEKSKLQFSKFGQKFWLGISIFMSIPIIMIFLSLALDQQLARGLNIVVAAIFFLFNLVGVPSYLGWYDRYLILLTLAFNILTIIYAWNWV